MTESVSIDAIGPGLKSWASDETAREIAKELIKLNKSNDKILANLTRSVSNAGKSGSPNSVKEMERELAKERKNRRDNTRDIKKNTDEKVKNTKAIVKSTSSLGDFARDLVSLSKGAIGALYEAITSGVDSQLAIYRSGAAFAASLDGTTVSLTTSMRQTGLTLGQMEKVASEFGTTLAREGTGAFTRYSAALRKSFNSLGMTSKDTAEWIMLYLEGQQKYAYQQNLSEYQQISMMRKRASELNEWSKVLGISKEQIQKSINAEKEKPNVAAFLAGLGPDASAAFEQAMQTLADSPALKGKLSDALADPFLQRSELFNDMAAAGLHDANVDLMKLHEAMRTAPQEVPKLMNKFLKSIGNVDTMQARIMGPGANNALEYVGEASRLLRAMATQKDTKRDPVTELARFEDAKQAFQSALQEIAINMKPLLPVFTEVINKFGEIVHIFNDELIQPLMTTEAIRDFARDIKELSAMSIKDMVTNMFSGASVNSDVAMAIGVGVAALFVAPVIIGAVASMITGAVGKVLSSALGAGVGAAGKAAGSGLQGIAAGLSFFSNPKVLLGGIALGVVIAAIGAGIAAATWLTGSALETFAKGMTHIQSLDGEKLVQVGIGIGEVAKGLLLFAAAKAAETLTSMFSAFSSFFTDEDSNPLVALQKFADASAGLSGPLSILGQSLATFAPNLKMIAEAFSYEFNFDFKKFREALLFLSGEHRRGLDPELIAKVSANLDRMITSASKITAAATATSKFAEAIMELSSSLKDIKTVGEVDLSGQLKLDEITNGKFSDTARDGVLSGAMTPSVPRMGTPLIFNDLLPSMRVDPAVKTPTNMVELAAAMENPTDTQQEAASASALSATNAAIAASGAGFIENDSKLDQVIDVLKSQLDVLTRIRKAVSDRGI